MELKKKTQCQHNIRGRVFIPFFENKREFCILMGFIVIIRVHVWFSFFGGKIGIRILWFIEERL